MAAALTFALLLSVCLHASASTLTVNANFVQSELDVQRGGNVCQDCTQIVELLVDMLSNPDLQKKIMSGIETVCDHLPGPATTAQVCKAEVEKMLPMAISFITSFVRPAEVCKTVGFCSSRENQEKLLSYLAKELLQASEAALSRQCTFCIFLVRTLDNLLPKERTEDAVVELLEQICRIVPSSYRDQCDTFIDKFSKKVMDAILSYATPQAICALLHMCKGQDASLLDPCTLPAYRCRDTNTALKCGTVFYCQRFVWKPLNTI